MNDLISKLHTLVYKDVGKESESNNTAILLRQLCLLDILHLFIQSFFMAFSGNIFLTMLLIFSIGILIGVFVCTFENKIKTGVYIFCILMSLLPSVISIMIGFKYFFAPIILIPMMLIYFSINLSPKTKRTFSVFCFILIVVLCILSYVLPMKADLNLPSALGIILTNAGIIVFSIALTAHSFCNKYSQSEEKIMQYNKKLELMVSTDALTTLWNRRAMNEHLPKLVKKYQVDRQDFSVAIIDIDLFKHVNDTYGHGMGDFVLKSLSDLLKEHMKPVGHVCRWGGEEFLLTFENMTYEQAIDSLEAFRTDVMNREFIYRKNNIHISITGGIEEYSSNNTIDSLITHADEKLYIGKTNGRNQIVSSLS